MNRFIDTEVNIHSDLTPHRSWNRIGALVENPRKIGKKPKEEEVSERIFFRIRSKDHAPIEPLASFLPDKLQAVVTQVNSGGRRIFVASEDDGTFEVKVLNPKLMDEVKKAIESFHFETVELCAYA